MPSLVLKTVVKNISFTFLLISSLLSYSHTTPTHPYQREMEPQLLVSWTVVRGDVGVRCECAEETMMIKIGNMFLKERHCERYFFAVIVKLHVVELKVEHIPLATID